MNDLTRFDPWLSDDGPAALVIREHLMPVDGPDGVVFPATFAAGNGFPGGYNIDKFDAEGKENVCLIDSVGSQANRIEPLFMEDPYKDLVPQIIIRAGTKEVNLLEAGHRAADAIVRCSELQEELRSAFLQSLQGDAEPLARIAPTSLVFGVWDSRDTQEKRPRLLASTIRAFNVRPLTRGAVYIPPIDYAELQVFSEEDKQKAEGDPKSPLAKRGFVHVPASATHGGVIATGGIRRDAILSLNALRLLKAASDVNKTRALQRYILGLALTAFTYSPVGYLRQGCNLTLAPEKPRVFEEVYPDGQRKPLTLTHEEALRYARSAATAFGVGPSRTVEFDNERAKRDVKPDEAEGAKPKRQRKQ